MLLRAVAGVTLCVLAAVACSDSDDDKTQQGSAPECAAIDEICHEALELDPSSTMAEACHDYAHDGDNAVCSEHKSQCVADCSAIVNAGGATGGGGSGTGGATGGAGSGGEGGSIGGSGGQGGTGGLTCQPFGGPCQQASDCCSQRCHTDHCH